MEKVMNSFINEHKDAFNEHLIFMLKINYQTEKIIKE